MRTRLIICAATVALVAAACGSDEATTVVEDAATEPSSGSEGASEMSASETDDPRSDDATSDTAEDPSGATSDGTVDSAVADGNGAASPALAGPGDVPDLEMINLHTDEAVSLQSVVGGQTPLLFWFFAPH